MKTTIIADYTFDKTTKAITFHRMLSVDLTRIVKVTNATNKKVIFIQGLPGYGGTVAVNVLTLDIDTNSSHYNNDDDLIIEYALENSIHEIIASASHVASGQSAEIVNPGYKGAFIMIDVTSVVDPADELTVKVQMKDHIGNWIDVPGAVTAVITAIGQAILAICPGITVAANAAVAYPMPRSYRLSWTIAGAGPDFIFSAGVSYID